MNTSIFFLLKEYKLKEDERLKKKGSTPPQKKE